MSTIAAALAGLIVYLYFMRKGQFDDIEDIKYEMFREENRE
jgi:hypothetical protein